MRADVPSPAFLAIAPSGARRSQADHPRLPITPAEIAAEAPLWVQAGVALLHLHARDNKGQHSLDTARYRAAIAAVRDAVGDELVIQITTEAVGRYEPAEQMAVVRELRPETASVAIREVLRAPGGEGAARDFYAWCQAQRVAVQHILYELSDIDRLEEMVRREIVPGRRHLVIMAFGAYAGRPGRPQDMLTAIERRSRNDELLWFTCAFGPEEARCAALSAALGGHVRVGFENNLMGPDGRPSPDNAAQAREVGGMLRAMGRPPASAAELRRQLGELLDS